MKDVSIVLPVHIHSNTRNACVAICQIFAFRLSSAIEASFVMPIEANIADARNTNAISNVDIGTFQWYSSLSIVANQHKANSTTYIGIVAN